MNVSIHHPTDRANFSNVTLGNVSIWFSYATPIAFQVDHSGFVIRHNEWGSTTGKHLAYLSPDKARRIDGPTFEAQLAEALTRCGVSA